MYLIAIAGATASGKTDLAITLAKYFDAEILSCDARQFYKEMSIGTAKPTEDQLKAATHHFIDNLSIHETYTVGDYEQEVLAFLDEYFKRKKVAILVGGSGLFYRAICEGLLNPFPEISTESREKIEMLYSEQGLAGLQNLLQKVDPVYYEKVDIQNPRRLIRALEVYTESGKPFSSFRQDINENLVLPTVKRPFKVIKIGLTWDRQVLYDRINYRVLLMQAQGLEAEARALYPYKELLPLQTVGYREYFDYWDGKLPDMKTVIEKIQQNTRNYAKRQTTWFNKEANLHNFSAPHNTSEIIAYLEKQIF